MALAIVLPNEDKVTSVSENSVIFQRIMVRTQVSIARYTPETRSVVANWLVANYAAGCDGGIDANDVSWLMEEGSGEFCIIQKGASSVDTLLCDIGERVTLGCKVLMLMYAKDRFSFPLYDKTLLGRFAGALPPHAEMKWGIGKNRNLMSQYQIVIFTQIL